jgi:SagB-type dehydrogenase family enzyme
MLFHARTRRGYARMLLGKTNPGKPDESPVSADPGPCIALRLPDLGRLCAEDLSFAEIAARRRSIRQYGANSLTLDQVSEFLFRTLHARDGRRPYPSGGGIYPLQAYLAVGRCIGLAPGGYAYDPLRHALVAVADAGTGLDGLLDEAMGTAGVNERPQVLLLLAARYALTARVYGDLAYGLILKEVGAVFQTAMLAATAMGIGSCPLGSGNSLAFAEWMNFDPRVETAVGELMLGSL